jgi:hypothetical protein
MLWSESAFGVECHAVTAVLALVHSVEVDPEERVR